MNDSLPPNVEPTLPSLQWLHRTLQTATEHLASELVWPSETAPGWSEVEWDVARAVASIHGVSGLLADRLRWAGPDAWSNFLQRQKSHIAARYQQIQQLLLQIHERAYADGIELVALKGAALHAEGIYVAGERPMADLDLLTRPSQFTCAVSLIESLGFRQSLDSWRDTEFAPANAAPPAALGEHPNNGIKVELHWHISEKLPLRVVDISDMVLDSALPPGLNYYPSKVALLLHLLLHASGALVSRELRLLHLNDIAKLIARMSHEDWQRLFHHAEHGSQQRLWWGYPPLAMTARYYGNVPEWVLARAAMGCRWWLKRIYRHRSLSQASLSYLWVSAFPGIEWARKPREAIAYAAARLAPSDQTIRLRRELARTQPRVSGGAWAHLSQQRRLVRWLLSRPPREATLQPVRAALGAEHRLLASVPAGA